MMMAGQTCCFYGERLNSSFCYNVVAVVKYKQDFYSIMIQY